MLRPYSLVATFAILSLGSYVIGVCPFAAGYQASVSQPTTSPPLRTTLPEDAAAQPLPDDNFVLVRDDPSGRPRERLRDRIRDRLEERRKATSASNPSFAPGLQPMPNPGGGAIYPGAQPPAAPRPLVERFRRMLGDFGLSVGSEGPRPALPEWGYGASPERYPGQSGPMMPPNFPAMSAPQPVQPAPPGPWLKSPGDAPTFPPRDDASPATPAQPSQPSPTANAPALPLLVPPDSSAFPVPPRGDGQTILEMPNDSGVENQPPGATDAPASPANSSPSPGGETANSTGGNAFGQLLGGVSRLFGGNAPARDTGKTPETSQPAQPDSVNASSSSNSPSAKTRSQTSDASSPPAGGTSKPSLEDIRKRVLQRSSRSN